MNRTKGILAAGTLTGLVLVTLLALGFGNLGLTGGDEETAVLPGAAEMESITIQQPVDNSADEAAVQAWQEYATDLENTVNTMQQRESEYQAQLDVANQTIIDLQNQANSANVAASAPVYDDDDESGEHEEHEREEHEHEEHENEEHDDD